MEQQEGARVDLRRVLSAQSGGDEHAVPGLGDQLRHSAQRLHEGAQRASADGRQQRDRQTPL